MVTLPKDFVATDYPGYFWNVADSQLYSVKVTGMLKPLALSCSGVYLNGRWRARPDVHGYKISHLGRKRFLFLQDLMKLTPKKQIFPVWKQLDLI